MPQDIIDTILDLSLAEPAGDAMAIMRLSLLDWLACGIAGRDEPVARITREMVLDEAGRPQATLFGGGRAPARAAALVNGATSHALDYDDTHFAHIGHPSVAVLPAALAVAEYRGQDLETLTRAALAGCEASVRFGTLFGRGHYQQGFHQTATAGAFGATLAACQLLTLDRKAIHHALALTTTRASGLKSQFGTMGKPFNAGIAAANGVEAALLAARGFLSNPDALTGENGFLATHHCDGSLDMSPGFLMTGISNKFHACCHGLHAMLEALETLKPMDPHSITKIAIETHPRWMTVCNQPSPTTGLEAKFSYRTTAALSLTGHDTAALTSYSDDLCTHPEVTALRDKTTVTATDTLPETAARITLTWPQGSTSATHDLNAPLTLTNRRNRLQKKARALLGPTANRLQQAILTNDLATILKTM